MMDTISKYEKMLEVIRAGGITMEEAARNWKRNTEALKETSVDYVSEKGEVIMEVEKDDGSKYLKMATHRFIENELVPLVKGICRELDIDSGWEEEINPQYQHVLTVEGDLVRIKRALIKIEKRAKATNRVFAFLAASSEEEKK